MEKIIALYKKEQNKCRLVYRLIKAKNMISLEELVEQFSKITGVKNYKAIDMVLDATETIYKAGYIKYKVSFDNSEKFNGKVVCKKYWAIK